MKTPAIVNPADLAISGKQSAVQIAAAPDVPFNQVLSREVANRNDSAPAETPSAPAPQASANNASPAAPQSSSTTQSASKAPGKSGDKDKTSEDGDKPAKDTSASDTATQNTPSDLLALVANIGQVTGNGKATAADGKLDVDSTKADLAKTGIGQIDTKAKGVGHGDIAKDIKELKAGEDGKDGKDADFATELKRGTDARQAVDKFDAKADIKAVSGEVAATELTAHAADKADLPGATSAQAAAALTAAQQAAQAVVRAAPGHASDFIAPRVGTSGWDQAVSQRVVWMVAGAEQSASLTLNPPDLGPLQVVLNVSNSTANATFVAAQPEVRQALEAAMPKLRDMLGDAGIQLGQATVSSGMQQNQNGGQADSSPRPHSFGNDSRADTVDTQIRTPRSRVVSTGNGLVDTFV